MKRKNIIINDRLYARAKAAASLEGIKIGVLIENALHRYFGDDMNLTNQPRRDPPRGGNIPRRSPASASRLFATGTDIHEE